MTTAYRKPYSSSKNGRETCESHESYGLLHIHRTQGGARKLFGSHIEDHHSHITLSISQAVVYHDLSRDWYHAPAKAGLIEIRLSAAQFAEAITSFNMGNGTPCTITRVLGESLEDVPVETETEAAKVRTSFSADLKELVTFLSTRISEVDEILEKKSLTLADKQKIRETLVKTHREVSQNLPFVLESFHESTEKFVTAAKAEVEAFISMGLSNLGMQTLQKRLGKGETPLNVLASGSDPEPEKEG